MGTKGLDLALYLSFLGVLGVIAGRVYHLPAVSHFFFWPALITAAAVAVYYPCYVRNARQRSKKMGLKCVVMLPVWPWWASLLIRMSRMNICNTARDVFEVHVELPGGSHLPEYLRLVEADLVETKEKLAGALFLWETAAPIPSSIRAMIRQGAKHGRACWDEGGWMIPRFPFPGRTPGRGTLRHGAMLVNGRRGEDT